MNQTRHIVLGDAESFGLGPRDGLHLLPVMLGSEPLQTFAKDTTDAAVRVPGEALGYSRI